MELSPSTFPGSLSSHRKDTIALSHRQDSRISEVHLLRSKILFMAMLLMLLESLVPHTTAPSCGLSSATSASLNKCASFCSYEARAKSPSKEIVANIDCASSCSGKQQPLVELVEIEDQRSSLMAKLASFCGKDEHQMEHLYVEVFFVNAE